MYGKYISEELIGIDYLWVDERYRHQKLGTKLMKSVEEFAKKHQVPLINLATMDFQAMGFYKKQGFSVLATVLRWTRNYDVYFMRKVL